MIRTERTEEWNPKAEAVRLWNADPCGGDASEAQEGSAAFFEAIDRDRYASYAPWLPAAAGFDEFRGLRLLEIGCGMGTDLASFARGGADVHAIDLTPRHLSIAARRLSLEGQHVKLARSDGEMLPFRDNVFDVVYSFGVLHHTPGTQQAIDEAWRVLRPGGRAVVALYHRDSVFFWFYTMLIRGIVRGALARQGYRRLLADIEQHRHSDAVPLVKVFGRREMRSMFRRFRSVHTEVHHLDARHFSYLGPLVRRIPPAWLARASGHVGWYIFAKATK